MQSFYKWRLKIFSGGNQPPPPVPSDFDGLPCSRVRGTPGFFFHQNDRKGCKRDYLDARGHFVLRFGVIGDKPLGGVPTPLGRRELKIYTMLTF